MLDLRHDHHAKIFGLHDFQEPLLATATGGNVDFEWVHLSRLMIEHSQRMTFRERVTVGYDKASLLGTQTVSTLDKATQQRCQIELLRLVTSTVAREL